MPLKNAYVMTQDDIMQSCLRCYNIIFPQKCVGVRHWERTRFDFKQLSNTAQQTAQNLMDDGKKQGAYSENVVGSYKQNVDTPYCCWVSMPCRAEQYDTMQIDNKMIAKLTVPCCNCCSNSIEGQDQNGAALGAIKDGGNCLCRFLFGTKYFAITDTNGNQKIGVKRTSCCSFRCCLFRCCTTNYKMYNVQNEDVTIGQANVKPYICIKCCCHTRDAIEVSLPPKASEADKALLLGLAYRKLRFD